MHSEPFDPAAPDASASGGTATAVEAGSGVTRAQAAMFAVVAIPLFMSTLDQTIVATALDSMQHGLGTNVTWVGWTMTVYSLGMVMMLSLAGKLTQRFGPRRVFLFSLIVFTGASLACGLVGDVYLLIALRFVQAVGGAGFTPSATRLVVEHFGPARDKAVGLFGTLFTSGAMVGPLVGGFIVSSWSWRGVFLFNVPIGLVLIPLCLRYVPSDAGLVGDDPSKREDLDLRGVTLAGIGLFGIMLALSVLGDRPVGWVAIAVVSSIIGVVLLTAFVRHIGRVAEPVIAPRLLYGKGFAAVNVINVLYTGAAIGLVALVPLYATNRYGLSTFSSGVVLAAEGAAAIVLSTLGALALRRTGYRMPLYVTVVFVVIGMIGIAVPPQWGIGAFAWLAVSTALVGTGTGIASPASRNAGLQLVPDQAAPIAALRSTGIQVGSIAAISAATAIISAFGNSVIAQAWVYAVFAGLTIVIGIPAVGRIPEHRGAW